MRRYKKKELLETVDMLVEANEVIDRLCKSNTDRALEILGQCQESAILLGNLIEGKGDGYAELVEILESYCENIYQMSTALNDENQIRKLSKKIQKQLAYLNNRIRLEIPEDKKEVVFFPYKASMWDSLESVWMAADADEGTDAYVVPIPYYDKNPDGSFREMHYEGNEYPDYVPVTSYEEYDFEERRPDIIFIHNPYDEFNYVTSVHPRFYSGNLKKFTEKLVYIPYFILGEIKPDDDAAIEGMKHFCINAGVKNADKVIVQSEDMRQVYIKVLTEESGGSEEARAYWENKIDGSGSPKVDKILNTKKEDIEIPEEWMKVIRKPDGSFKKIIFYNTGVTALLEHDEQMLKKMESVFQVFQERQDEVALLWRPHPLIESTLISMRPELWESYRKIRAQYREEGWGIYDDTADMDRAVVLSDAYYGDWSSIVHLYKKTGKPMMIQNVYSLPENNYSLAMDNIVEFQGEWWFLALKDNGLYRMNKDTFEATLVVRIPWDECEGAVQYGKIYCYKSKIFIIPWAPIKIAVYDLEIQSLYYIDYERETTNRGMVFCEGVKNRNKLYLIPCAYENILCLDMETEQISYIRLDEALREKGKQHLYAWGSIFIDGETVYMTMLDRDLILGCELRSGKVDIYRNRQLIHGGAGICGSKKDVWIVPKETDRIIHWNRKERTTDVIRDFPMGYKAGEFSFHKMKLCEKYLYLLPRDANMCIVVDRETEEVSYLDLEEDLFEIGNYYDKYFRLVNVWEEQGDIYLIQTRKGEIYCINEKEEKILQVVRQIKGLENCGEIMQLYGEREHENRFENIKNYINMLNYMEINIVNSKNQIAGKKIWLYLK